MKKPSPKNQLSIPTSVISMTPLIAWYPWQGPAPFVKTKIGRGVVVATIPGSVLVSF